MDAIPQEVLIVGGLGLVILAAVIVARWGKQILLFLFLAVGVVVLALIAWALLQRPDVIPSGATETIGDLADIARVLKPESEPQPTYTAPASSGGGFLAGVLVALVIVALGAGGYFFARWKLAERGGLRRQRGKAGHGAPVVYVIQGQADDLGEYDLIPWQEVGEWTEEEADFSF